MTYYITVKSPIGKLLLTSDGEAVTGIYMEEHEGGPQALSGFSASASPAAAFTSLPTLSWEDGGAVPVLQEARRQLDAFFDGKRESFDLPLKPAGTPFQRTVWDELTRIPFGKTISYGELAKRIGQPAASRAVGLANGKNPIAIVIPCHRVIGANGTLTGYGGGIDRKKWLLEHEGVALGGRQPELALQ